MNAALYGFVRIAVVYFCIPSLLSKIFIRSSNFSITKVRALQLID